MLFNNPRGRLLGAVSSLALLVTACGRNDIPSAPRSPVVAQAVLAAPGSRHFTTIDDDYNALVDQVPGFGGQFFDASGILHVYLKDPSQRATVASALASFLDRHGVSGAQATRTMIVERASFDFRQLFNWYGSLVQRIDHVGITQTAIDKRTNQLEVGVRDAAVGARVSNALSSVGIPATAARVVVIAPTYVFTSLQQYSRPVKGGLQLTLGGFYCTMGFLAYKKLGLTVDSSTTYFVTNSHCTDSFGVADGQTAGQPDVSNPIGTEISDPAMHTNATDANCPVGRNCRYSDAALFQLNTSVSKTYAQIEKVSGLNIVDYYTITTDNGYDNYYGPTTLMKVGRTTGYSSGLLTAQCAAVAEYDNGGDTGRTMLCQDQANLSSGAGDSGSPVFHTDLYGGKHNSVQLDGVMWGGDGSRITYSPWSFLRNELQQDAFPSGYELWVY